MLRKLQIGRQSLIDETEGQVVAESKDEAIEKVLIEVPRYRNGYDAWASEFKIAGYVIEVYDEKTYNREKNLENLLDN